MSRASGDEVNSEGRVINGYDYEHQAWVEDGRYLRCGHPYPCDCYGTAHEGELSVKDGSR